ncbi:serine/threonine-protein kinase pakA isoform X1 [Toxotes jaculatrix]|uniref:serine/threonine-protein kinase pakA isoform X1 n=1 Tax=Toxotes jaculatrix TaxID=941984 RepID=UPI001B3ABD22|nr:serine/threonine-protein kinase pakA isoform X1 [Toxotes jaculatrix]XP_040905495.1 serine/threonine-protein kinase pakA isoform X1 [Toxotes jaculatrix]XP_040905505.1 serine/threonine-protein kinase pakA isoform X1 [Toxotes jaculatrix]
MEVTSHSNGSDITESGASKNPNLSEAISSQPTANGTLPHHSTEEAPPPLLDRSEDGNASEDSLTGSSSTNDIAQLLPSQPASALRKHKGVDSSPVSPPPVCAPPSSSFTSPPPPPSPFSQSSTCNRHSCSLPHHHHHHHGSTNQKRLSSTKSHASFKTNAAHIKEVAGDGEPISFDLRKRKVCAEVTWSESFILWSRTEVRHRQTEKQDVCIKTQRDGGPETQRDSQRQTHGQRQTEGQSETDRGTVFGCDRKQKAEHTLISLFIS